MADKSFPLDRPQRAIVVSTPDENNGDWVFYHQDEVGQEEFLSLRPDAPDILTKHVLTLLLELFLLDESWKRKNLSKLDIDIQAFIEEYNQTHQI